MVQQTRLGIPTIKRYAKASQGGFVQDAALANELAGTYFLKNRHNKKLASLYLTRAKKLFTEWGATAKVKQMQAKYRYSASSDVDVSSDRILRVVDVSIWIMGKHENMSAPQTFA
jgi:hypothetical protein